jgi:lysophospholipase L1-like esterase
LDEQPFPRSAAEEVTTRLLLEFKRAVTREGAKLLVVLANGMTVAQKMADFLTKYNIDSLVLDEYIDINDQSLHLPDGFHWNPAGHKIVATVLAERLRKILPNVVRQ